MSERVQYTIVAAILICAIVWIIIRIVRKRKKKGASPCCGCSIADVCSRSTEKERGDYCEKSGSGGK